MYYAYQFARTITGKGCSSFDALLCTQCLLLLLVVLQQNPPTICGVSYICLLKQTNIETQKLSPK
jgi:hypothetical protein